jgi:hypothetical protein
MALKALGMGVALPEVFAEHWVVLTETTFGIGSLVSPVIGITALAQILVGQRQGYSMINPCLMPRVTASVRLEALSLARMEPT